MSSFLLKHKIVRRLWSGLRGRDYLLKDPSFPLWVDLKDQRGPSSHLIKRGLSTYEPEVLQCMEAVLGKREGAFLDLGANIGIFTVLLGIRHPEREVLGFEPHRPTFKLLEKNIELHGLSKAQALPWALGNANGEQEFYESAENAGHHALDPRGGQGPRRPMGKIEVRTLDSVYEQLASVPPALVKVDVEGFELEVFEGAQRFLEKYKPHLIFEVSPQAMASRGRSAADLLAFVGTFGYSLSIVGTTKPQEPEEILEALQGRENGNLFGQPL